MKSFILKNNRATFIIFAIIFIAAVLLFYVLAHPSADLPVALLHGSSFIDRSDPKAVIGDADYTFIGRVDNLNGTVYKHVSTMETEKGEIEVGRPYTDFTITVIKNIKGNLRTDIPIKILKSGGISMDKTCMVLFEGDKLPEVNKIYVFIAYAQSNGSLLLSGPTSNILLDISDLKDIAKSKVYKEYVEAFENEARTYRKRFRASDDAFKDNEIDPLLEPDSSTTSDSGTYDVSSSTSVIPS